MPIRSPIGDLGPLGDFLVKIGPLLYKKSPFQTCECKKVIKLIGSVFVYELIDQINIEKVKFECL